MWILGVTESHKAELGILKTHVEDKHDLYCNLHLKYIIHYIETHFQLW